jgi:hypothetical protein
MSRQQKRAQLRETTRQGRALLREGVARRCSGEERVAAALALCEMLRAAPTPDAALATARAALALFEASERRAPAQARIACRKGCNWCCHLFVTATVPEILLLSGGGPLPAREGVGRPPAEARAQGPASRIGRKVACPVLTEAGCARYERRPLMCRVTTSLDVQACIDEYEGRDLDRDIPVARGPIESGFNTRAVLLAALTLAGLDAGLYELAAGLDRLDGDRRAAERWLAGERILDGVERLDPDPALSAAVAATVAAARTLL